MILHRQYLSMKVTFVVVIQVVHDVVPNNVFLHHVLHVVLLVYVLDNLVVMMNLNLVFP